MKNQHRLRYFRWNFQSHWLVVLGAVQENEKGLFSEQYITGIIKWCTFAHHIWIDPYRHPL